MLSQAITLVRAEAAALAGDHSDLAVPDPSGHDSGLLPPRGLAGDGQPGRGQAGGRPAEAVQADRHGDRPGLCLGHGRQHPRHLPDRLRPDRHPRDQGRDLVARHAMAFAATLLGSVWHAVWAGIPLGLCVLAFTPLNTVPEDGQGVGNPRGTGRSRNHRRRLRLGRREQLLLHQGRERARAGHGRKTARWCSTT